MRSFPDRERVVEAPQRFLCVVEDVSFPPKDSLMHTALVGNMGH